MIRLRLTLIASALLCSGQVVDDGKQGLEPIHIAASWHGYMVVTRNTPPTTHDESERGVTMTGQMPPERADA